MNKKILSFLMLLCLFVTSTIDINAATNIPVNENVSELAFSVFSEAFPEAYVEKEYLDLSQCNISIIDQKIVSTSKEINSKLDEINKDIDIVNEIEKKLDDNTVLYGVASASVYVKEKLELQKDESYKCVESKLLSKEEIDSQKYFDLSTNISTRATTIEPKIDSYGKLTLRLYVYQDTVAQGVQYILSGNAYWSNYGSDNAASKGDDFMGLYWGGGYDYKNYGQSIVNSSNESLAYDFNDYIRIVDQTPNTGIVWQFPEYKVYLLTPYYAKQITVGATVYKNTLTGSGNTTGVVLKYIHTYENHNATVVMNVASNASGKLTGTFSLSSTPTVSQWSLAVSINGLTF